MSFCIALENGDILRCNAETKAGEEGFQKCSEKEREKKEPEQAEGEEVENGEVKAERKVQTPEEEEEEEPGPLSTRILYPEVCSDSDEACLDKYCNESVKWKFGVGALYFPW